jgi:hypothetical protein
MNVKIENVDLASLNVISKISKRGPREMFPMSQLDVGQGFFLELGDANFEQFDSKLASICSSAQARFAVETGEMRVGTWGVNAGKTVPKKAKTRTFKHFCVEKDGVKGFQVVRTA